MPAPAASPIALRLTLSFVAVLALLIALSGMTVFRMEQLARSLHRLSEDQLANQELIADVGENAEDAARKLLVLISAERPERVLAYAEIDAANRRLDAAMTVLDTRFAGGPRRAAFLGVAAKLQNYRNQYSRNVDLIEAEDWVSARRMLLERTEVALAELSSARDNLGRSEHDSTLSGIDTLEARLALDRRIVVALCLGGLAVGAALAWLVIRGIVVPLRHAEAVARRLTGGDYASRVQVTSDDEVGRVSAALNSLAVAVADREEALRRLAQTDVLTGLAQRARFVDEGDRLVAAGAAGGAALLCMDIDRLKLINAVLGFDAGDAAIVDAAARIARTVGDQGVVGRLAGGTFAALVRTDARDTPDDWVRRLHGELDRQVSWGGQSLDLSLTIGVAHASARSGPCEILLRHAEQAMFEAKRRKTASQVFVDAIEADRASHLTLLSDLGEAIAGGQLQMFVQPKVGTLDLQPCGVEALVRWEHPQRGWISPAEFIPFAEGTGRIRQITQWMLERAVQTLAEWQRQGRELCIAVNVSTVDLQDRTLGDRVEALLRAAGVAPRWLQLELTETGLMASGPDPIEVLHRLRALGVRLAIDDFGTGQSSLGYLQKLPVHELKIDRSFVDGFAADPRRRRLLRSIVSLGHGMDLTVTAEGVETPAELAALRESGCDLVQGFLIGRPMTVARFDQWRASRSVEPSTAVADNAPAACPE